MVADPPAPAPQRAQRLAAETYVDLGVVKQVPTPGIFPAAAHVVVPVLLLRCRDRRTMDAATSVATEAPA